MTRQEIKTRLCRLASEVGDKFNNEYAHDCFCGQNPLTSSLSFNFDEEIIKFIESAVNEKIEGKDWKAIYEQANERHLKIVADLNKEIELLKKKIGG